MPSWAELFGYGPGVAQDVLDAVVRCDGRLAGQVPAGVLALPEGSMLVWVHEVVPGDVWELRRTACEGLLVDSEGSCCWALLEGEVSVKMCELEESRIVLVGGDPEPIWEPDWDALEEGRA